VVTTNNNHMVNMVMGLLRISEIQSYARSFHVMVASLLHVTDDAPARMTWSFF
jgi:hypothetical protein